jgi:hypothetical protein
MPQKLIRLTLKIDGLAKLKKNTTEELLVLPWATAMRNMAEEGLRAAKAAAPVGPSYTGHVGGNTLGKLRTRVQARPLPLWARIETTAVRAWSGHGNYSYAKRVEWDPKLRHVDWLKNAVISVKDHFEGELRSASKLIESDWLK